MKKAILIFALLQLSISASSQGAWYMKANFANPCPTNEAPVYVGASCLGFAIDSVLYAYNGDTANNFSAFDPSTNQWTHRADFPGLRPHYGPAPRRCNSAGFAIGQYGYIGTGWDNGEHGYVDFWQYNATTDSWTQKANYPGPSVNGAFGFSIGDTGYIAGGANAAYDSNTYTNYAYLPATDTWVQKANIPLRAPCYGFSAVLSGMAYLGVGRTLMGPTGSWPYLSEFYAYEPSSDTWTARANFPASTNAMNFTDVPKGFALGGYVYLVNPYNNYKVYRFSPASNAWDSAVLSYPAAESTNFFGASLLGKGYFCGTSSVRSNFWEFNPAQYFNITSYTPDTVCQWGTATVKYSSDLPFGSSDHFSLAISRLAGSGTDIFSTTTNTCSNILTPTDSSGTLTFTILPGTTDLFIGQLLLIDSSTSVSLSRVTARSLQKIDILTGFAPEPLPASYAICNGHSQTLSVPSVGGLTYYWATATGVFDSTSNSITVSPITTTAYYLKIAAANGCVQYDTTAIIINGNLAPNLPDSAFTVCPNASIAIGGPALANATYEWTDNHGFTSNAVSPVVSDSFTDVYYLTVHDTLTGCNGNASVTVTAKTAPAQLLCLVTVDSATNLNQLVWEKLDRAATDSFHIYREVSTNGYTIIASIPGDSLSSFEDGSVNPGSTSYRYKITALDTCGNESILSPYHNTIYLQYIGNGQLTWNDYAIENLTTPVTTYNILIDSLGTGSWQLLLSVPGTQNAAADVNYAMHSHARYLLQANFAYTCIPTRSGINFSLSNKVQALPTDIAVINADMIGIFPNPVNDVLYLQSTLFTSETLPLVCDITGQQIAVSYSREGAEKLAINTKGLAAGMYWVKLNIAGQQVSKKFIKAN